MHLRSRESANNREIYDREREMNLHHLYPPPLVPSSCCCVDSLMLLGLTLMPGCCCCTARRGTKKGSAKCHQSHRPPHQPLKIEFQTCACLLVFSSPLKIRSKNSFAIKSSASLQIWGNDGEKKKRSVKECFYVFGVPFLSFFLSFSIAPISPLSYQWFLFAPSIRLNAPLLLHACLGRMK